MILKKTQSDNMFQQVDSEQMIKQSRLPELQKQARKGKSISATDLEICKHQINNMHQSYLLVLKGQLRQMLDPIDHHLASLKLATINSHSPIQAQTEVEEQIRIAQINHAYERDNKQQESLLAKKEELLFRARYKITRLAERPKSRLMHIAVAIFLVLVESVGNGFFLAQGLDGGLLAGLVQAFVIASISVYLSYMTGVFLVRGLFHSHRNVQMISGALLSLFSVLIIMFHMSVAHLRISLDLGEPKQAYHQAIMRMLEVPFQLTSFDSVMLLILGIVFSLTALIAGAKADDIKPGYGKLSVRSKTSESDSHDLMMRQLFEMDQITQPVLDKTRAWSENYRNIAGVFLNTQLNKHKIMAQYELAIDALNNSFNHCLAIYRVLNPEDDVNRDNFDSAAMVSEKEQYQADNEWLQGLITTIKQSGDHVAEFQIKISHIRSQAIEKAKDKQISGEMLIYSN